MERNPRLTESFLMFPRASGSSCAMSILCKSLANNRMLCVEGRGLTWHVPQGRNLHPAAQCAPGSLDVLHLWRGMARQAGGELIRKRQCRRCLSLGR